MNKAEFLKELEKRLHVLNDKERSDVLEEYAQHIEFKMESGLSEQEAVRDFGSFDELVAELLDAYSINSEYAGITPHKNATGAGQRVRAVCRGVSSAAGNTVGKAGHAVWGFLRAITNFLCGIWMWICRIPKALFHRRDKRDAGPAFDQEQKHRREPERQKRRMAKALRRFLCGCICLAKGCVMIGIKIALLVFTLPFGLCGLLFLFLSGLLAVLTLQGYPVIGIGIFSIGAVLISLGITGILLSWVFERKDRKKEGETS